MVVAIRGASDDGMHTVCVEAMKISCGFLGQKGNDLSTPNMLYDFPGLKDGDRWCLCVRWKEAYQAGHAPLW
ncbi:MAG: DUF2237 family protein [Pirellulaceae bacterium]